MRGSILHSYRWPSRLLLSLLLVFALTHNASADKDHPGKQRYPRHSTTVVKVPGAPPVPVPGGPVLGDKPAPQGYVPPKSHKKKEYSYQPQPGTPKKYKSQKHYSSHKKNYREKQWRHWDREYGQSPWDYRHRPRYGSYHRHLPSNSYRFYLGGVPFFYVAGVYFQTSPQGYVVVKPPIGSRIQVLPEGCSYFMYGSRRCYTCDDVFYEEMGSEYVVINQPPSYRLIADPGDEIEIDTSSLNVRSGPGLGYDVVDRLQRGDVAEVIDVEDDWYYVNLGYNNFGWIKRQYTRIVSFNENAKG